jgi:predicted RNase H-like HicB family nuclease
MSKILNAIITEEDGGFVALNPETGVASQGDTVDESLKNLKEAVTLYLQELGGAARQISAHRAFLTTITI